MSIINILRAVPNQWRKVASRAALDSICTDLYKPRWTPCDCGLESFPVTTYRELYALETKKKKKKTGRLFI